MPSQLAKKILDTIVFYDILDFPLTSFEIWKNLIRIENRNDENEKKSLGEIIEALEGAELRKQIEEFRGFYFLKERRELVEKRIQNDKNSIDKFKIAEKVARKLRWVPFVRMIAVTGTLAMKNCENDSDIDFFAIIEKGRMFTGRTAATAMIQLLGRRRHGAKIKNRICLNYFVTTGSLEIERKDLFAANEYTFIYPLFGDDVFQKFCAENLAWIRKSKPNWEAPELNPAKYRVERSVASCWAQKAQENLINFLLGDRIEAWLRKKQVARINRNPLTKKEGAYVKATNENLIFLPEPQGVRIEKEFRRRLGS